MFQNQQNSSFWSTCSAVIFPRLMCFLLAILILIAGSLGYTEDEPSDAPPPIKPGLPENLKSYKNKRHKLLAANIALRFDADMELNPDEERLNKHLIHLRNSLFEQFKSQKRFPPSEPFSTVKKEIRQTPLYKLLRNMPKGGVLHIHTSSTVPTRWILEKGILEPHCYVCWPSDKGNAIRGQLGFFRPEKKPPGYQAVRDVISEDPDFPNKLLPLITISEKDFQLSNQEIWKKFDQIFQRTGSLASYQPLYKAYYLEAFKTLVEDQVHYVELRAGLNGLYDLNGKTWEDHEQVKFLWEVRNRVRKSTPEFDLKLIYSGHRRESPEDLWPQLKRAVEIRKQWEGQNFLVGFDLVGEEDAGHTTEYFLSDWAKLKPYLQKQDATLPLYFHDGESDWPNDTNLFDAFLLGSRRIGHGFNLFHFPALEQELKANRVAIEVCPISNQMLRYVNDLRIHPAQGYLNRGLPCVLGNDDPAIFGNDGLSYDYWQAVVAWKLDLRAIKQLAFNSLEYSAMTEDEKLIAMGHWRIAWNHWVTRQNQTLP